MLDVPPVVRNKAAVCDAAWWLDGLPELVAGIEHDWAITTGRAFADATEAVVLEAIRADGTPAVLKLVVPRPAADLAGAEITVLELAGGDGCARLLRHDAARGALLLERLGPSMYELGVPFDRRLDVLSGLAARVWRPAPGCGLPTGADHGRRLAELITTLWDELDRPCSARAVDDALACAARRVAAHDDERAVLVHGDVHQWNALQAGNGFRLVDPDGLLAEPALDLGVIMREDPVELVADDPWGRARSLAARCGVDATAVWEWGVVERVSSGLWAIRVGLEPVGRQMLEAADRVAA